MKVKKFKGEAISCCNFKGTPCKIMAVVVYCICVITFVIIVFCNVISFMLFFLIELSKMTNIQSTKSKTERGRLHE